VRCVGLRTIATTGSEYAPKHRPPT